MVTEGAEAVRTSEAERAESGGMMREFENLRVASCIKCEADNAFRPSYQDNPTLESIVWRCRECGWQWGNTITADWTEPESMIDTPLTRAFRAVSRRLIYGHNRS